jgi:NAD(P)-dependent dehydrogenase (short-subunit alcohol dehydrogenase family)
VAGAVARPAAGRVALVTGGAGRIGAAVVRALAARAAAVAIHCHGSLAEARALVSEIEAAGVSGLAVTANFRDEGSVRALVHRVTDHFGRLDALIGCAGICRPAALEDVTADDLRAHFEVNCIGGFVAAQEAGAVMVHQESGGAIVTLGDTRAERPVAGHAACLPSQGAIPALTRSLAVEFAARHARVRVNCVLHGPEADPAAVARTAVFLVEQESLTGGCLPAGESGTAVR